MHLFCGGTCFVHSPRTIYINWEMYNLIRTLQQNQRLSQPAVHRLNSIQSNDLRTFQQQASQQRVVTEFFRQYTVGPIFQHLVPGSSQLIDHGQYFDRTNPQHSANGQIAGHYPYSAHPRRQQSLGQEFQAHALRGQSPGLRGGGQTNSLERPVLEQTFQQRPELTIPHTNGQRFLHHSIDQILSQQDYEQPVPQQGMRQRSPHLYDRQTFSQQDYRQPFQQQEMSQRSPNQCHGQTFSQQDYRLPFPQQEMRQRSPHQYDGQRFLQQDYRQSFPQQEMRQRSTYQYDGQTFSQQDIRQPFLQQEMRRRLPMPNYEQTFSQSDQHQNIEPRFPQRDSGQRIPLPDFWSNFESRLAQENSRQRLAQRSLEQSFTQPDSDQNTQPDHWESLSQLDLRQDMHQSNFALNELDHLMTQLAQRNFAEQLVYEQSPENISNRQDSLEVGPLPCPLPTQTLRRLFNRQTPRGTVCGYSTPEPANEQCPQPFNRHNFQQLDNIESQQPIDAQSARSFVPIKPENEQIQLPIYPSSSHAYSRHSFTRNEELFCADSPELFGCESPEEPNNAKTQQPIYAHSQRSSDGQNHEDPKKIQSPQPMNSRSPQSIDCQSDQNPAESQTPQLSNSRSPLSIDRQSDQDPAESQSPQLSNSQSPRSFDCQSDQNPAESQTPPHSVSRSPQSIGHQSDQDSAESQTPHLSNSRSPQSICRQSDQDPAESQTPQLLNLRSPRLIDRQSDQAPPNESQTPQLSNPQSPRPFSGQSTQGTDESQSQGSFGCPRPIEPEEAFFSWYDRPLVVAVVGQSPEMSNEALSPKIYQTLDKVGFCGQSPQQHGETQLSQPINAQRSRPFDGQCPEQLDEALYLQNSPEQPDEALVLSPGSLGNQSPQEPDAHTPLQPVDEQLPYEQIYSDDGEINLSVNVILYKQYQSNCD